MLPNNKKKIEQSQDIQAIDLIANQKT